MTVQRFSTRTRAALWRAYDSCCFYCRTPITFVELEIDHLIPESLSHDPDSLRDLLARLDAPQEFDLNCLENLVPTHANCNRRKSRLVFSEPSTRYYRELARARVPQVRRLLERLSIQAANEKLLIALAHRIEIGLLSTREVDRVLSRVPVELSRPVSEPVVVGLSVNVADLEATGELPPEAPTAYPQLCDWLEQQLLSSLRSRGATYIVPCEASERNGETLGMRLAAWAVDINGLAGALPPYWQVVEVAPYGDVYDQPPDGLFLKALVQGTNALAQAAEAAVRSGDPDEPFRCCPRCGSQDLSWSHDSVFHLEEDLYYFVKCRDCGWSHEER